MQSAGEPKTYLANERTFLSWLHMAVTLGSVAAALLGFTNTATTKEQVCLCFSGLSVSQPGPPEYGGVTACCASLRFPCLSFAAGASPSLSVAADLATEGALSPSLVLQRAATRHRLPCVPHRGQSKCLDVHMRTNHKINVPIQWHAPFQRDMGAGIRTPRGRRPRLPALSIAANPSERS